MQHDLATQNALLPGGRLGQTRHIFGFEADFARDLRCIPMVVRFKLDRCGVKLSLKQWSRIGQAQRFVLADLACDTDVEASAYRNALLGMIERAGCGDAVLLASDPAPVWADLSAPPGRVTDMMAMLGHASMDLAAWRRLSTLERFALLKLTRPGHDNDNFEPALREFGLIA